MVRPSHLFLEQNSQKNQSVGIQIQNGRFKAVTPCLKLWRENSTKEQVLLTESCYSRISNGTIVVQSTAKAIDRDQVQCENVEITEHIRFWDLDKMLIIHTCSDRPVGHQSDEAVLIVLTQVLPGQDPVTNEEIRNMAQPYMSRALWDVIDWSLLDRDWGSVTTDLEMSPCVEESWNMFLNMTIYILIFVPWIGLVCYLCPLWDRNWKRIMSRKV